MTTPNPRKPDLMRISSGRRVIDRCKAGDRNAQRHTTTSIPGEIAYFQDAQDAIAYVEMVNQHTELKRLEDGIRALHSRDAVQVITGDCATEECGHENECPTVPIEVCAECYRIAEEADPYYGENGVRTVLYPCPTIALLDGEARA